MHASAENSAAAMPLVVLAGESDVLYDVVEKALAGAECRVRRYRGMKAFLEDAHALRDAAIFLGDGWIPMNAERLGAAPGLTAIICPFTGTEGFDIAAATELGIIAANGQVKENVQAMAEATVLMLLAALYDLPGKQRELRDPSAPAGPPFMLAGKTIGFVGYGGIAEEVTLRLESWGAEFLANTSSPRDLPRAEWVTLDALIERSDIVCVLAALNESTQGLLDAKRLRSMKPGAFLVVMSRGGIVDEKAAAELTASGHLRRVAFDVFAKEPCPADNPLRALENAILTPHSIGHASELLNRLPIAGVEKILSILEGRIPENVLNPDVLPTWRGKQVFAVPT